MVKEVKTKVELGWFLLKTQNAECPLVSGSARRRDAKKAKILKRILNITDRNINNDVTLRNSAISALKNRLFVPQVGCCVEQWPDPQRETALKRMKIYLIITNTRSVS